MLDVHGPQASNETVVIDFFFSGKKEMHYVLCEYLTYLICIFSDFSVYV